MKLTFVYYGSGKEFDRRDNLRKKIFSIIDLNVTSNI